MPGLRWFGISMVVGQLAFACGGSEDSNGPATGGGPGSSTGGAGPATGGGPGSSTGGNAGAGEARPGDFWQRFAAAMCDRVWACRGDPVYAIERLVLTEQTCPEMMAKSLWRS